MPCARPSDAAAAGAGGASATGPRSSATRSTQVPPLVGELGRDLAATGELPGQGPRRDRPVALGVAGPAHLVGCVEQDRHGRQAGRPGLREPAATPAGIEPEGVDDGGQATAEPGGDDGLEHRERVGGGVEVVRSAAHDRTQGVGGDDLVGAVVLRRPGRLARGGGTDEHDECRVGERHGGQSAPMPRPEQRPPPSLPVESPRRADVHGRTSARRGPRRG